ncbi:hypothetical protein ACB094_06G179800 [Castanea mollissima]
MEESPKSSLKSDLAVELTDLLKELDGDGELTEFTVKEELIEEVMQELYKEIMCTATSTTASNISTTLVQANFPSQSPLVLPVVAVSDGGKSESCGASVSDSTSTVMTGIEFVGPNVAGGKEKFGSSQSQEIKIGFEFDHGMMINGCDGGDFDDDEWLARVLGWDPQEQPDQCII